MVAASWGFVLGSSPAPRPINARSETVASHAAFRQAFLRHRAALPATGFYEWKKPDLDAAPPLFGGTGAGSLEGAWLIEAADGGPFALAALTVRGVEDAEPRGAPPGFCVLTTSPNAAMARIHRRMPVVLAAAALERWLDPTAHPEELAGLLGPVPAAGLRFTPLSSRINRTGHEGSEAVQPRGPTVAGATFASPPTA